MEYRGKQYSIILTIGGKWKWSAEIDGQYRSGLAVNRPAGVKLAERAIDKARWRRKRSACAARNKEQRGPLGTPNRGRRIPMAPRGSRFSQSELC
jgi:hypothetical protein